MPPSLCFWRLIVIFADFLEFSDQLLFEKVDRIASTTPDLSIYMLLLWHVPLAALKLLKKNME